MSEVEREKIKEIISGMTLEEQTVVAEFLPVDLCMKRIDRELVKAHKREMIIKELLEVEEE